MKKYTLITLATIVTLTAGICIAQTDDSNIDAPAGPGPTGATNSYSAINATSQSNALQAIYARSATYPVSMDYSKTSDQLMATIGLASMNKDANISLGILSQARNVGTGSSTLTVKCVPQGNFLPATNYAGAVLTTPSASIRSATLTMDQYFGYMHAKGYRPLTANELLATVAQYPNSMGCMNIGYSGSSQTKGSMSAYGSAFELPNFLEPATATTTGAVAVSNLPFGSKIFVPTVSNGDAYSNAYSFKLVAPQMSQLSSPVGKTSFVLQKGVLIVVDPSVPVATTIKINALPTQSASQALGSSNRYVGLTGENYSVTVNYDSMPTNSAGASEAALSHDIPNNYSGDSRDLDDSKYSGTHNISVIFAVFRNPNTFTSVQYSSYIPSTSPWIDAPTARGLLIKWMTLPENSGYRFATSRELRWLNNQYPNKFPFVAALGSYNGNCDGWPILLTSTKGVSYTDFKYLDYRPCGNGWLSDSSKNPSLNGGNYTYLSSCWIKNTYNINEWRFALVPKSSYNPAGY
jgi:hypothetical protein